MKKTILSLLITILFTCCNKSKKENILIATQLNPIHCTNWVGMWFCFEGDSIMKDSIVITVKNYGFKNDKSFVQYECNVSELDSLLWHYCPIQKELYTDDIHLVYKGKNMYFRYYH